MKLWLPLSDNDGIDKCEDIENTLYGMRSYNYAPKKLNLGLQNKVTPLSKLSIE